MEIIKWVLVLGLSFLSGVLYVNYLTVHPLRMSRYLLATGGALLGVIVVLLLWFRGAEIAIAVALSLGFAFAGYVLMTRRFLSREDSRPVPELTRAKGDSGLGHTAVIYFTHGEPETYDPIGWINQFNEWDEQGVPAVPFLVRPFFFHRLRKKYLEVGKSHHRGEHAQMLRSLERAFRAEGDNTTKFYLSFLDDNPRPDAAVVEALNDGASRVLVSEVFLTISNHTAEGKELIEALGVEGYGVPIEYTGPLYDSETLKRMFVQRANASLDGLEKSKVGVLLVGHGQPDEWDIEWPTETEHEMAFRHDILELLAEDGFDRQKLDLAWMEFKKPRPAAKVEEFVRNGVRRVLYFSAAISADGIHSQWDVPALVNKAQVPPDVALVNLGAWNNDPLVIQAIKEKIDRLMHGEPQQG